MLIPGPGSYLSLRKEQKGVRRVGIGRAFLGEFKRGQPVIVELTESELRLRPLRHKDPHAVKAHVVRQARDNLYITISATQATEKRYPSQKYQARRKDDWIVAQLA